MELNLFEKMGSKGTFVDNFIKELGKYFINLTNDKKDIKEDMDDKKSILEEYDLFEKKKIFLDNKSRNGNPLAWVMDDQSVCLSEDGDGGACFISEINLPRNAKVGQVYEKVNNKYVLNRKITDELNMMQN